MRLTARFLICVVRDRACKRPVNHGELEASIREIHNMMRGKKEKAPCGRISKIGDGSVRTASTRRPTSS